MRGKRRTAAVRCRTQTAPAFISDIFRISDSIKNNDKFRIWERKLLIMNLYVVLTWKSTPTLENESSYEYYFTYYNIFFII